MDWARDYIGIEFAELGRTRETGLDCWGLVRLVYAERFGVILPAFDAISNAEAFAECTDPEDGPPDWEQVRAGDEIPGDLVLFSLPEGRLHVGLWLRPGEMLHAIRDVGVCREDFVAPIWIRRFRGCFRYRGPVVLTGSMIGPQLQPVQARFAEGSSIESMLERVQPGLSAAQGLRVWVSGNLVDRQWWRYIKPRAGRRVTIAVVPEGGGGKNPLRLLATIAIIAAAASLPGAIGLTGFAAAALTAGVGIGGTLLLNALIPPARSNLGNSSDVARYAISGTQNQARRFEAVPVVLGRHRIAPPYGAAPYTEIVGDDQYLRVLFVVGTGPLELSDFKIGDTPLDDFEGVEIETRPGREDDEPLALYPSTILEDSYSVLIDAVSGWISRTTRTDVDEISIDVTFPQGLARLSSSGSRQLRSVSLEVEYAPAGSGAWQAVAGTSPDFSRGMDFLFRGPECPRLGSGLHSGTVNWGLGFANTKPAYLPATGYSWAATGYIYAGAAGTYTFALDGSDALDLYIDGRRVVSWYGSHTPVGGNAATADFSAHQGEVTLTVGWHRIVVRMEARTSTGAIALGWKRPGDGAFSVVPASVLRNGADGETADLNYVHHDTSRYLGSIRVEADRVEQIRRNLAWAVPRGQYDVRVRRVTLDATSDDVVDQVYLTAVRSIRAEDPLRLERVAKIALRIQATNQLQGVVDEFNCLASSIVPDWDSATGTWIERASSTPASLYRWVLQGPAAKRPVSDARLDLVSLQRWAEASRLLGLECNLIVATRSTVYEVLATVAAAGRASFNVNNGLFGVVRDYAQTVPVQLFTPRNSSGFKASRQFNRPPHGIRVRFISAEKGYGDDERIVLADGYQIDGLDAFGQAAPDLEPATEFDTLDLPGVVTWPEVFKHARYYLAVLQLRPETYEITVDWEHLVCTRGDLVLVSHDVPLFGLHAARIVRLVVDASDNLIGLVVDERITMLAAEAYSIRVRLANGTIWTRGVLSVEGYSTELTLSTLAAAGEPRPEVGDLLAFGRTGQETRECIVRGIEPGADLTATLILVDHAPAVHESADGPIPPYDPGISEPVDYIDRPERPVIDSIRSDDLVMIRDADGSLRNRMLITLRPPSTTRPIGTIAQIRTRPIPSGAPSEGPWTHHPYQPIAQQQVSVLDVEQGVTYDVRIRTLTQDGRVSDWAEATHTVVGKSAPPPQLASADVSALSDGTRLYSWTFTAGTVPPDLAGVLIRYGVPGSIWDGMTPLRSDPIEASPYEAVAPPAGFWRFGFRTIDTSGNLSPVLYVDRTLGEPRIEDIAFSSDAAREGWPGTKSGCHVAGLVLEADDTVTTWANAGPAWDSGFRWNNRPTSPISYVHTLDAGQVLSFSPDAQASGSGIFTVEVAWSTDGLVYTAYAEVSTVRAQSVEARYLRCRVTVINSAFQLVPTIASLLVIMRARSIVHELQDIPTAALSFPRRIAAGDVRLPVPVDRFSQIRGVNLSFNGTGGGWTWELVDRDVTVGPRVRLYDGAGNLADATIDAVIRGI